MLFDGMLGNFWSRPMHWFIRNRPGKILEGFDQMEGQRDVFRNFRAQARLPQRSEQSDFSAQRFS